MRVEDGLAGAAAGVEDDAVAVQLLLVGDGLASRAARPRRVPGSAAARAAASVWCALGITRTCVGACGLMSRKATVVSVSRTIVAGIVPCHDLAEQTVVLRLPAMHCLPATGDPLRGMVARRSALAAKSCRPFDPVHRAPPRTPSRSSPGPVRGAGNCARNPDEPAPRGSKGHRPGWEREGRRGRELRLRQRGCHLRRCRLQRLQRDPDRLVELGVTPGRVVLRAPARPPRPDRRRGSRRPTRNPPARRRTWAG